MSNRLVPELPKGTRIQVWTPGGPPLGNCGRLEVHNTHVVWDGDHEVYGPIFDRYLCDGNISRDILTRQSQTQEQ